MKTRTLFRLLATLSLTVSLLLAGCALGTGGGGDITFNFSPSARALGSGESYRVEIYYGLDRYASVTANTDEPIVFEDLPTGEITVAVAQGRVVAGSFVASRYGSMDLTIVPGDNNPSPLTLQNAPFFFADTGGGVTSVVAKGSEAFYTTSSGSLGRVTYGAGGFTAPTAGPAVPAGLSVSSLSLATVFSGSTTEDQVWVNTGYNPTLADGGGIIPWNTTLDTLDGGLAFSSGFDLPGNWESGAPSAFTVLRSGTFIVPDDDSIAIFFQRNGGLGGVYLTRAEFNAAQTGEWPWIIDQIDLSAELGIDEPLLDFVVGSNALYAVTVFTTLKVSDAALDSDAPPAAEDLFDPASGMVGFATGIPDTVVSMDIDEVNAKAYLGTGNGLWMGGTSSDAATFFAAAPGPVAGTLGYAIGKIRVSPDGKHVAFVTRRSAEGPDFLGVLHVDTSVVTVYRSFEGLPGEALTDLTWFGSGTLLVAGNAGLAALDVAP